MKPLKIDFLPERLASVWMVVACTVMIAIALGEIAWLRAGEQDLEVRRAQLNTAKQAAQETSRAIRETHPEVKPLPYEADVRRAMKETAFNTAQALTAIERVAMVGATPTSIELQAETGLVRLEIEYTSQEIVLKYLAALNEGEEKPRWQLLRSANRVVGQPGGVATLESTW